MSTFIEKATNNRFTVSDEKDFRYEGGRLGELYEKVAGSGGVESTTGIPVAPHRPFPRQAEV